MKKKFRFTAFLIVLFALLGLLFLQAAPAQSNTTFAVPTQQLVGLPAQVPLVSGQGLTNTQTVTLNAPAKLYANSPYADYLPLWATTVCTNPLVAGTTTVGWKFAWDAPQGTNATGTNFIGGGSLAYANTGTTNATGFTNIPAIYWRGATAIEVTTITTTGQTNGSNGSLIGQTTSVYLNQTR